MSDTDFFLNQTGGSVSTQLGTRLSNIKNQVLSTQSVIGIQPDNSTDAIPYTAFGKSLLSVSTLNGLVGLINSADTQVQVIDSGTGEINFTLDNQLKLVVKNLYTEVLNELRSLNIVSATDLGYDVGSLNKRYNYGYFRRIASNTTGQVAIGDGAGITGTSSVNIGHNAGASGNPDYSVSIGRGANNGNTTGYTRSVSLGYAVHQNGVANDGCIAIGFQAGQGAGTTSTNTCKANSICLGYNSGQFGLGTNAIAIGPNSCLGSLGVSQGDYGIAIGSDTAKASIGTSSIAIGRNAGLTTSHNNSIILNATGVDLSSSGTDRCHIAPIRSGGTGNVLNYDTGSKEVLSGGNVSMQTLTSQALNPDVLNSRNIGTTSLPWNGVYCNGIIQPSATTAMSFNTNSSDRMFINSSGTLVLARSITGGSGLANGGIMLFNGSGNNETRGTSSALLSNEIRGLSGSGADAGLLRIGAGGGSSTNNHSYIDFEGFGTRCIKFNTGGALRAIIDASGYLGVGTSTPTEILDVVGNVKITGNVLFDADNQRNVGSSGQALNSLYCHSAYFKSIQVHSATAGNIGTLANPFNTIYLLNADIGNLVSNIKSMNITPTATNTYTIGSSSSTQYNAIYGNTIYGNGVVLTSDINKKKDIQAIEDALSIIMRFESKSFKFKDGTSNRTHTGFIAQQIKEVIPDDWALYCDNKLGDIGLKYTEVIPLNTRAIQQLNERLSKVESRKLVGGSVIDTSGLTEDFVRVYERLEALESEVNKPVKPQLHRCVEISRINELFQRISNLECNESKSNSSEDFELMHSLMEKNHSLEMKVNELSDKIVLLESRSKVESKSVDLLAESDGGLNMNEILQTKNYELEQRILKLEKQNKKLVQAVNRLLKTNDE